MTGYCELASRQRHLSFQVIMPFVAGLYLRSRCAITPKTNLYLSASICQQDYSLHSPLHISLDGTGSLFKRWLLLKPTSLLMQQRRITSGRNFAFHLIGMKRLNLPLTKFFNLLAAAPTRGINQTRLTKSETHNYHPFLVSIKIITQISIGVK